MLGSVDKTGKYIIILNKVSSVIVLIVSCIIIKNIWHILANYKQGLSKFKFQ